MQRKFKGRLYAIVIAIGIISFWRGLWGLLEIYIFPNNPEASYLVTLLVGLVLLLLTEQVIDQFGDGKDNGK